MDLAAPLTRSIVVERRFRGPTASGNGGYSSGCVAAFIDGPSRVTLHTPPALDRPLTVRVQAHGSVTVHEGDALVAEAVPWQTPLPPPARVDGAAREGVPDPEMLASHPFPQCFVCGPERETGDGLRIFPARLGSDLWAAAWIPTAQVPHDGDTVRSEVVWSVLDCPSGWALADTFPKGALAVLGRMTADVRQRPRVGEPCVVVSWPSGANGRKYYAGSVLYGLDDRLLAVAETTWIQIR